jgi:hypothetical protein
MYGSSGHERQPRRKGQNRRDTSSGPNVCGFQELPAPFDAMPVGAMYRRNDLPIALHEQYPAAAVIGKMNVDVRPSTNVDV